jgi:hypothetical protein
VQQTTDPKADQRTLACREPPKQATEKPRRCFLFLAIIAVSLSTAPNAANTNGSTRPSTCNDVADSFDPAMNHL